MIEISARAASVITRSQRRHVRVSSWYGTTLLADDIPISGTSGREEVDRSSNVPERVTFTVPRLSRGVDLTPIAVDSPLAANGQRIRVQLGIGLKLDTIEWLSRGEFVITRTETRGDFIDVEAAGLLWLIQEARLVSPLQPSGTFVSTIRDLLGPGLPVKFDAALTDRAVPASVNYDQDRLAAVYGTLAAWPAEGHVTEDGFFLVKPAEDATDVAVALTDGQGGTVIRATGSSSRDGAYNAVVARGTTSDGGVVQGVAYDTTGPKAYGGPFNALPVPLFYESPLLTTRAEAQAAAQTRMAAIKRRTARTYTVEMIPNPALQAGDRVTLTTDYVTELPAIVEALALPWQAQGGAQSLTVREVT